MCILTSLSDLEDSRSKLRLEWSSRLSHLSSQLSSLKAANPRSTWTSSSNHEKQMANYGQKTLELAKQISKLEMAISGMEGDVKDCREELERLERSEGEIGEGGGDDDESGEYQSMGERELGAHA